MTTGSGNSRSESCAACVGSVTKTHYSTIAQNEINDATAFMETSFLRELSGAMRKSEQSELLHISIPIYGTLVIP